MSSPQTEDGYTRIANELLDAILRYPFSKRELNIVLAVIRKTYGYNKKSDDMTLTQLADLASMDLAHVSRTVAALSDKNVLLKQQGKYGYVLGINKKYNSWVHCQNGNLAKTASAPCQNGNIDLPKQQGDLAKTANTKDNPKRQSQKTTTKDKGGLANLATLPGWLPVDVWAEFKSFRREIKKPLGPVGESRALLSLSKLREAGQDPLQVISQSIENGWAGLFAVKKQQAKVRDQFAGAI